MARPLTVNVNGDGIDVTSGNGNVTFTVGQLGGNINVLWNDNNGIDVFQVWDVTTLRLEAFYTAIDSDGVPGMLIVDGPFYGANVAINMVAVPEASTTAMLLAGLGWWVVWLRAAVLK